MDPEVKAEGSEFFNWSCDLGKLLNFSRAQSHLLMKGKYLCCIKCALYTIENHASVSDCANYFYNLF